MSLIARLPEFHIMGTDGTVSVVKASKPFSNNRKHNLTSNNNVQHPTVKVDQTGNKSPRVLHSPGDRDMRPANRKSALSNSDSGEKRRLEPVVDPLVDRHDYLHFRDHHFTESGSTPTSYETSYAYSDSTYPHQTWMPFHPPFGSPYQIASPYRPSAWAPPYYYPRPIPPEWMPPPALMPWSHPGFPLPTHVPVNCRRMRYAGFKSADHGVCHGCVMESKAGADGALNVAHCYSMEESIGNERHGARFKQDTQSSLSGPAGLKNSNISKNHLRVCEGSTPNIYKSTLAELEKERLTRSPIHSSNSIKHSGMAKAHGTQYTGQNQSRRYCHLDAWMSGSLDRHSVAGHGEKFPPVHLREQPYLGAADPASRAEYLENKAFNMPQKMQVDSERRSCCLKGSCQGPATKERWSTKNAQDASHQVRLHGNKSSIRMQVDVPGGKTRGSRLTHSVTKQATLAKAPAEKSSLNSTRLHHRIHMRDPCEDRLSISFCADSKEILGFDTNFRETRKTVRKVQHGTQESTSKGKSSGQDRTINGLTDSNHEDVGTETPRRKSSHTGAKRHNGVSRSPAFQDGEQYGFRIAHSQSSRCAIPPGFEGCQTNLSTASNAVGERVDSDHSRGRPLQHPFICRIRQHSKDKFTPSDLATASIRRSSFSERSSTNSSSLSDPAEVDTVQLEASRQEPEIPQWENYDITGSRRGGGEKEGGAESESSSMVSPRSKVKRSDPLSTPPSVSSQKANIGVDAQREFPGNKYFGRTGSHDSASSSASLSTLLPMASNEKEAQ